MPSPMPCVGEHSPFCDSGRDVRDPQLDWNRAVGPRADGRSVLRDRGHSETAVDIGANLPCFEHRCPHIPEVDCTDNPRPGRGPCSGTDRELQAPHAPGQQLRHGQSATGGLETLQGQSTAVQAGMVLWVAARQHRMQLVHSAPIPTKGHSRQPVGVGDCVLSPANWVSTQ